MNSPSLYHKTKLMALQVERVAVTATTNSTPVAVTKGVTGEGLAILSARAATCSSDSYLTVKLQHGDESDGSDAANMTKPDGTAAAFTALDDTGTGSFQVIPVNLNGAKKYIRAVATRSGTATTPSWIYAVCLVTGGYQQNVSGGPTF